MRELPRRLWHILGGLCVPVAGLLVPEAIFLPALVSISIALLIFEAVRLRSPQVNRRFIRRFQALLREREASMLTASTYFLMAASIVFILCDKSIAAIAMTFVAVGDPVAGVVGERWGKPTIRGKSLEGSGACLAVCLVAGAIMAAITHVVLLVVVVGAICASVVEFLSLPPDDNLTMPLVAGGVMSLVEFAIL